MNKMLKIQNENLPVMNKITTNVPRIEIRTDGHYFNGKKLKIRTIDFKEFLVIENES